MRLPVFVMALVAASCAVPHVVRQLPPHAFEHASIDEDRWWELFSDKQLNLLIERALSANPSIKSALARLQIREMEAKQRFGDLLPELDFSVDHSVTKFSKDSLVRKSPLVKSVIQQTDLLLNFSYEIDFFGKNRKALQEAIGIVRASEFERQEAKLIVAAQVATAYFRLKAASRQLSLYERALLLEEKRIEIIHRIENKGVINSIDLERAKERLHLFSKGLEEIKAEKEFAFYALKAAIGVDDLKPISFSDKEGKAPLIPEQIPLDLLGRKPELRALIERIKASGWAIESAKTTFYPSINLNAFLGLSSLSIHKLFIDSSMTANATPAIHLPIFYGGKLRAFYKQKIAEEDNLIHTYEKRLIDSTQTVLTALSDLKKIEKQLDIESKEVESRKRIFSLTKIRELQGIETLYSSLEKESEYCQEEAALIELQLLQELAHVKIMESLGGSYGS